MMDTDSQMDGLVTGKDFLKEPALFQTLSQGDIPDGSVQQTIWHTS